MKALVTGGGGFLGRAVAERLVARGDAVRSFARGDYPDLRALGVEVVRGDIQDAAAVREACRGVDVVYHVAARPGIWGSRESFHGPNVTGTRNVLAACKELGIGRLVYTSSPSVVFSGRPMEGVDESVPYPEHYEAWYPETKAIAEREVLASNGPSLATVSLRPHLIWGPRDNHLVPRIVARGRSGALRKIGKGGNLVDAIYVDNAADAHVLAGDRLAPGSPVAGKAYFLTNGEPLPLWDIVDAILRAAGLPPVTRSIPLPVARAAGAVLELVYRTFRLPGEPRMTRFVADELALPHWFDIGAARRDLGYAPAVSMDEGFRRLAAWLAAHPVA